MVPAIVGHLAAVTSAAYNYSYTAPGGNNIGHGGRTLIITLVVAEIVLLVISVIALWKVFVKAGRPGWAAIVPFYNGWVLLEMGGKPGALIFLALIPLFGTVALFVIQILAFIELAKRFGKSGGFAALLVILPFIGFPILAFGKARYAAPADVSMPTSDGYVPPRPIDPTNPGQPYSSPIVAAPPPPTPVAQPPAPLVTPPQPVKPPILDSPQPDPTRPGQPPTPPAGLVQ